MNYTGWLVDGTEFDTQDAYDFVYLGQGDRFIPGFEIGIDAMAQGGVRRIIIPPALAYGAQGVGPIPPGAIVIFEVEFVSVTAP
jgi:FKBP-type peptidyl-prolyl cis-trans isomerase